MRAAWTLDTVFCGEKSALFALAFKLSLLTVATLGFYRFWMKTRLRCWHWSAIQPGGHPLEYTGNALEKLLGFLIAVVFLAIYICIVNLTLMYASFTLFGGTTAAYALSIVGLSPFVFYAQYRARQYLLARTRWRGIRFGQEPGAWGYVRCALLYWGITALTLGLLWPLQTFRVEQFRTDRTWFGSGKFHQDGRCSALIVPWLPCFLCVWVSIGLCVYGVLTEDAVAMVHLVYLVPLSLIAYIFYSVRAFRYLSSHKRVARTIRLLSQARVARVLGIHILGNLLVGFFLSSGASAVLSLFGWIGLIGFEVFGTAVTALSGWTIASLGLVSYFSFFVMWDVLRQVFVRLPLLAHYAATMKIENAHLLADLQQRDRYDPRQAEGFAEALDVGAAL